MASNSSKKWPAWCVVALLTACKPDSPPPSSAPTEANTTAPAQSPAELEAESSLSIKRGIVAQTDKAFGIRLCSANNEIPVVDGAEGVLARVYGELGSKPIYVEAYGERVSAGGGSFALEELLYATATNPTNACTSPPGVYDLLARGSEPSWSVEVNEDSMLLRQNDAPTEIRFTGVNTADTEGAVTYRAGVDKHVLELTVTLRACRDEVSGEFFAYTATAKFDKHTFNGCARVGE
jgi:uncharacterized membrane protein